MSQHGETVGAPYRAYIVGSMLCNVVLLVWGIRTLMKPGGPRGEELVVVYWWVVPLIMALPAKLALQSWFNHWYLTRLQLFFYNVPFALTVGLWGWVAFHPA